MRGIAILGVLWYHAYPGALIGFIGVDIFFVISGFLISSIIFSNLEKNTFSFSEFYIRRIRRILPALITVMLASLIFGWFALTAEEYQSLGQHIAGGAVFVSNFLLWSESGYFDDAAATKPMLHLWSLAIEEQFYIFWPLLMIIVWRNHKNFLKAVAIIGILSFAFSIYQVAHDPSGSFYSPFSRFWELMAGSVIAYMALHKPEFIRCFPNLQSTVGFLLLLAGFIFIDRGQTFPGWWVLLPVLGTSLIISAGHTAWINRYLLSNRFLLWVGLISYPLYLWHWVLLSFLKILKSDILTVKLSALAVAISFILAWLTYKLIEHPCRFGKHKLSTSVILLSFLAALGIAGHTIYQHQGLQSRQSAPSLHEANHGDIGHAAFFRQLQTYYPCLPAELQKTAMKHGCLQSRKDTGPDIAIIGDSHAQHVYLGLAKSLPATNILLFMQDGFPELDSKHFHDVMQTVIHTESITKVVLAAYWKFRIRPTQLEQFKQSFGETVKALTAANKAVYIIEDLPHFSFRPAKCKYAGRLGLGLGPVNKCSESSAYFYREKKKFTQLLKKAVGDNRMVKFIDISRLFCDTEQCHMAKNGELFYRDTNHLNINGSIYAGKAISRLLDINDAKR